MKLVPYRIIAKNALMSWNGLSEEEAQKIIETSTFDELESQVYAKGSVTYAVEAVCNFLGHNSELKDLLLHATLGDKQGKSTRLSIPNSFKMFGQDLIEANFSVLDILSCVHDGWVKDNAKKFNKEGREGKKYQHLPIEMIGWKEAKADLLFVEPILDAMGIKVNENELEEEYNKRVVKYFNEKGLVDESGIKKSAVTKLIVKGKDFYAPLTEVNSVKNNEEAEFMTSQVCEKLSNINLKTKSL